MDKQAPVSVPETGLLREPQVRQLIPVSTSTLRRMWERGAFPKPHKLGAVNVWRAEDVRAFLAAPSDKTE